MRNRKWIKGIAILIAMGMLMACTACGAPKKEEPANAPKETQSETKAPEAAKTETKAPDDAKTETTAPDDAKTDPGTADGGQQGTDLSALKSQITESYMGLTEAGEGAYFASNDDGSFVIVAFYDPATNESASFVGPGTITDEGLREVKDEQNGLTLSFGVEPQEDGTLLIDLGDLGQALIAECTADEIIEALQSISDGSNPLA